MSKIGQAILWLQENDLENEPNALSLYTEYQQKSKIIMDLVEKYKRMSLKELEEERVHEYFKMKRLQYADEMYFMEQQIDLLAIIDKEIARKRLNQEENE